MESRRNVRLSRTSYQDVVRSYYRTAIPVNFKNSSIKRIRMRGKKVKRVPLLNLHPCICNKKKKDNNVLHTNLLCFNILMYGEIGHDDYDVIELRYRFTITIGTFFESPGRRWAIVCLDPISRVLSLKRNVCFFFCQ